MWKDLYLHTTRITIMIIPLMTMRNTVTTTNEVIVAMVAVFEPSSPVPVKKIWTCGNERAWHLMIIYLQFEKSLKDKSCL